MKKECSEEDWKKGKKVVAIICIIVAIIVCFLCLATIIFKPTNVEIADNRPISNVEFSGPKYKPSKVYSEEQENVTLSNLADKPMALIFFNTTNEESLEALKLFAEQEKNYDEKVNIAAICVLDGTSENTEKIKATLSENGIILKNLLFDLDYSAKNEYNVSKIPTFVFVNKNQEIINTLELEINEDILTANLDILAENY